MSVGVSEVYAEEGERWLRVSPGHAISERWLQERAPELYAQWRAASSAGARDQLALQIERRLEELESTSGGQAATAERRQAQPSSLADRVARYEHDAERFGAIALADPARRGAHLTHQADGDALRDDVTAVAAGDARRLLERRLDAADLVADRPVVEAVSEVTAVVDVLAARSLAAAIDASGIPAPPVGADAVRAEMAAEDPHAALRAEVLLAAEAAGIDLLERQQVVEWHSLDLVNVAPALAPASDFYARHQHAIHALLDREIAAGGHTDPPDYIASWRWGRPTTPSRHDIEQAIVGHVVAAVISNSEDISRDLRDAQRMWERAADRAAIREWSTALERSDLDLAADRVDTAEQPLDLGWQADDDIDAGHDAEQEAG